MESKINVVHDIAITRNALAEQDGSQKPLSISSFTQKSGPPAWKHIPSWYLVSLNDQMSPPHAEEFTAKRMGQAAV
jgi:hypothetical protein